MQTTGSGVISVQRDDSIICKWAPLRLSRPESLCSGPTVDITLCIHSLIWFSQWPHDIEWRLLPFNRQRKFAEVPSVQWFSVLTAIIWGALKTLMSGSSPQRFSFNWPGLMTGHWWFPRAASIENQYFRGLCLSEPPASTDSTKVQLPLNRMLN